jgi:hypothetical protein
MSAALQAIESQSSAIKSAFTAGKPDDAHDALHEIGHALEAFQSFATKEITDSGLAGSVKDAIEKLLVAYGALDDGMHGGKETKYEEVEKTIDESLQILRQASPAK